MTMLNTLLGKTMNSANSVRKYLVRITSLRGTDRWLGQFILSRLKVWFCLNANLLSSCAPPDCPA